MMWALVRRHPAWDNLPRWLGIGLIGAFQISGFSFWALGHQLRIDPQSTWYESELFRGLATVAVAWVPLVIYLVFGRTRVRCTQMDLTLPIPARTLHFAHRFALVLAGGLCLVVGLGLVLFQEWLFERLFTRIDGPLSPVDTPHLVVLLFGGLVLVVTLVLMRRDDRRSAEWTGLRRWLWMAGLLVLGAGLASIATLPIGVLILLPWLAIALSLITERRLPAVFSEDSSERPMGEEIEAEAWDPAAARRPGSALGVYWNVWRSLLKKPAMMALGLPFLALFGVILSGRWLADEDLQFGWVPITAYTFVAFFGPALERMHRVDFLPIPRRRIFAMLVLPLLLLLILGYAGGQFVPREEDRSPYLLEIDGNYELRIAPKYFELVNDAGPRVVEAPWGESHEMRADPVLRGRAWTLVKPYTTPAGSSIDYVAWQLGRAVEGIYGVEMDWREIRDRYLELDAEGRVVPRGGEFRLMDDHPELRRRTPGRIFPVLFLLVGLFAFPTIALQLRLVRHVGSLLRVRIVFFGSLGLLLAIHVGVWLMIVFEILRPWAMGALVEIGLAGPLARMPLGTVGLWLVCGLLLLALYRLAERQFEFVEALVMKEDRPS